MTRRALLWVGSSRADVRSFPPEARYVAGLELMRVQEGLEPRDRKAMPSVGLGVWEIRIHTGVERRVLYISRFREAVYVIHAFEKKSRTTAKRDIELARRRLRGLNAIRARRRESDAR
jgi:phage-related protein